MPEEPEEDPIDPSQVVLPEALHQALVDAAGNHSVSDLRRCLEQLEPRDEPSRQLARRLREFGDRYDMGGVASLLQETSHQ